MKTLAGELLSTVVPWWRNKQNCAFCCFKPRLKQCRLTMYHENWCRITIVCLCPLPIPLSVFQVSPAISTTIKILPSLRVTLNSLYSQGRVPFDLNTNVQCSTPDKKRSSLWKVFNKRDRPTNKDVLVTFQYVFFFVFFFYMFIRSVWYLKLKF